jgi:transcriptional regulator with XRE-family HTH domain
MTKTGRPKLDQRAFEIASRIRKRREELGLSCSEVARRVGQVTPTYRAWEKQFGLTCQTKYLGKLSQVLSISEAALVGEDEWPSRAKSDHGFCIKRKSANDLSPEQLELLGRRAKDRRKELKLSRSEAALRAGIKPSTLIAWEMSIGRNISQESIEAWESALGVPKGWLLNLNVEIPTPDVVVINTGNSLTAADEIRKIGCWIARRRGTKTTDSTELTESEVRTANIFAMRYGVIGEEASTLQSIGDLFGLTRERVRQIIEKALERLHSHRIDSPVLDTLFNDILRHLPASVADIDRKFREQLGESLSVESLDRFSREILGKGYVQITERPGGMAYPWERVVINPSSHNEAKLRAIRDAAIEMIRSCGGAQINWVAGTASWQCGEVITPQDSIQGCRMIPGFSWLVEEDGWFWFGEAMPSENRVLSLSKKMLAVAGRRLDTGDIHQGLSRSRRYAYDPNRPRPVMIEPPLKVVKAILSQVPWVKPVQSDDFLADPAIPVEDVLSDSELEIFNLMLSAGGVISRHDLSQSVSGDFSSMTLALNLDVSPIISRLDTGVYALRGRKLNLESIQRAMESVWGRRIGKPVEKIDGGVRFNLTISEYHMRNKFIEVPASVTQYLEDGEYDVDGFDTKARYSITFRRLYQLVQKMIKLGYRSGDTAAIRILTGEKIISIDKAA